MIKTLVASKVPITRQWSMPSKWTFEMKPVRELFERYQVGHGGPLTIDPFAGMTSPAHFGNDINPASPAMFHMPALEFLTRVKDGKMPWKGTQIVLFDPPYSIHQVKVSYDSYGLSLAENITGGFPKEKDAVRDILGKGGLAISFGWNTVGMGKKRGFAPLEYMIISHGGNRNDTLVTVEEKL